MWRFSQGYPHYFQVLIVVKTSTKWPKNSENQSDTCLGTKNLLKSTIEKIKKILSPRRDVPGSSWSNDDLR